MNSVYEEDICYVILLSPTEQDRRDMEIIRGMCAICRSWNAAGSW